MGKIKKPIIKEVFCGGDLRELAPKVDVVTLHSVGSPISWPSLYLGLREDNYAFSYRTTVGGTAIMVLEIPGQNFYFNDSRDKREDRCVGTVRYWDTRAHQKISRKRIPPSDEEYAGLDSMLEKAGLLNQEVGAQR